MALASGACSATRANASTWVEVVRGAHANTDLQRSLSLSAQRHLRRARRAQRRRADDLRQDRPGADSRLAASATGTMEVALRLCRRGATKLSGWRQRRAEALPEACELGRKPLQQIEKEAPFDQGRIARPDLPQEIRWSCGLASI